MRQVLGIDIGGTGIKWALVSDEYEFGERGSIKTPYGTPDDLVGALVELIEPLRDRICGIGISAPGGLLSYADDPTGTIHRGGALYFMDGFPLARPSPTDLGCPSPLPTTASAARSASMRPACSRAPRWAACWLSARASAAAS